MWWPRFELRQELCGGLGSTRLKLRPRKWKTVCHIKRNTLIFDNDAFTVPILTLSCFNVYNKNWKNGSQNKLAAARRNKCTVTLVSGLNRSGLIWFGLRRISNTAVNNFRFGLVWLQGASIQSKASNQSLKPRGIKDSVPKLQHYHFSFLLLLLGLICVKLRECIKCYPRARVGGAFLHYLTS